MADSEHAGARCLRCGYALRGLSETVCSECGRVFVCADQSTFVCGDETLAWQLAPGWCMLEGLFDFNDSWG